MDLVNSQRNPNQRQQVTNLFFRLIWSVVSIQFKGSDHSEFLTFVMIKCVFLTDLRSKTMTCYTFSVRPTIPEYRNVKVAMKFDEEENEDFSEEEYFNFEELSFGEEKNLETFLR